MKTLSVADRIGTIRRMMTKCKADVHMIRSAISPTEEWTLHNQLDELFKHASNIAYEIRRIVDNNEALNTNARRNAGRPKDD